MAVAMSAKVMKTSRRVPVCRLVLPRSPEGAAGGGGGAGQMSLARITELSVQVRVAGAGRGGGGVRVQRTLRGLQARHIRQDAAATAPCRIR